jgi:hypothetical protein
MNFFHGNALFAKAQVVRAEVAKAQIAKTQGGGDLRTAS